MIARGLWIAATVFRCLVAVAYSAFTDGSTALRIV